MDSKTENGIKETWGKVGITAGTFDFVHAGHVLMFKEAKTQCDYLIVCLLINPTKDRDWKHKPVQSVRERLIQLEGCKYVDEIIIYETEKEFEEILMQREPDIRIIGEEYKNRSYTGDRLPIKMYFNSQDHTYSSTELRDRIKKS